MKSLSMLTCFVLKTKEFDIEIGSWSVSSMKTPSRKGDRLLSRLVPLELRKKLKGDHQ